MICHLKVFTLAWSAALAIGVIAVPIASGQVAMGTSPEPATLVGMESGEGKNTFTGFGMSIECPGSTYTGHKATATPHQFIPNGATEVTFTAHFVNCTSPVHTNGCDIRVRDGTTTSGVAGTYGGVADLVCPAGKSGVVTGAFGCNISFPSQNGLSGLHLTATEGTWDLGGTFSGITATNACFGHTSTAQLHVNGGTIKAYNALGEEISGTISD
jgi:hypothetical protein